MLKWRLIKGRDWRRVYNLTENNGSASITMTADELQEIQSASAQIEVGGTRYNEAMEKSTGL